jgi:hypothetical protein
MRHVFSPATVAAALLVTACTSRSRISKTSPDAEQLRWLDQADVAADFRDHVEQQHDTRFISVFGLSFATEFPGLEDTPDAQRLAPDHGSRRIEGTTDSISSSEQNRLLGKAFEYARRYNIMLLIYLAAHPNT